MQRRIAVEVYVLIIGLVLVLPAYAYIYSQGTQQATQTILNVYGGVETVQVSGSIPNEMDRNRFGFFGVIFWNPTSSAYEITRVEINASGAINRVFIGVEQGAGKSSPTSGWILDMGRKAVYLTLSQFVNPHAAQEFFVRIKGIQNVAARETFNVAIRVTANGTVYERSYLTVQKRTASPSSLLRLGAGATPQFVVLAMKAQQTTFYVSLQEDAGEVSIGSNGKLTINLPVEFTNVQDVGGAGWGTPTITGNSIEVSNTVGVIESYITYAFKAVAPTYKGLYMVNVSFTGTPNENPMGNFCVSVGDGS